MRRRSISTHILPFFLSAGSVLQSPGIASPADSTTVRAIRPGVSHTVILRDEGPWVINVVQWDLSRRDLRLCAVKAFDRVKGKETTSAMAGRSFDSGYVAVAAVNGDFFSPEGEPSGQEVNAGNVVLARAPREGAGVDGRSHFGMTASGCPFISQMAFRGIALFSDGKTARIARVNAGWEKPCYSLFNSFWGNATPPDTVFPGRREWGMLHAGTRGDTALYVAVDSGWTAGATAVPPGGIVLSAGSDSAALYPVRAGDTVRVLLQFEPMRGAIETLVGGGPRIVLDGRNVAGSEEHREGMAPAFSTRRHPRSGIGFSADSTRLYFVTVDGRQDASAGMTLPEFAELMLSIGVAEGTNLDGGGSTTLVVEGRVVNSPSDAAGERPVTNCIVLLGKEGMESP